MPVRVESCPGCRQERVCRIVSAVRVEGEELWLLRCLGPSCGLVWAVAPSGLLLLAAA